MTNLIFIAILGLAQAEEPAPVEVETVEEKAEETAPIPTEVVNEIEGPEKAVEEKAEEKAEEKTEEKVEEKAEEKKAEVPEDYNEAVATVSALVKAIQSKNWPVVAGLILMLLVFIANKFGLKDKVGAKAIPWVSLVIGVFATSGMALASGVAVTEALIQGLSAGLAAVGSWETLFKHILGGSSSEESA